MSMEISADGVSINDVYRLCNSIAGTPKDKKRLEQAMEKVVLAQDGLASKYKKVPFERLESLQEEDIKTYTKGLDKALRVFEKSVERIAKSKKTREMKFSVASSRDGKSVYAQSETGFKATTLLRQVIGQSIRNTRAQTMSTIADENKKAYYSDLSKRIDAEKKQADMEANVKKGRDMYYTARDNSAKVAERKAELRGNIDFGEKLARETYSDAEAQYRYAQQITKDDRQRLSDLEGNVK